MPYRVEIGSQADAQLAALDSAIGASVERKNSLAHGKRRRRHSSASRRNAGRTCRPVQTPRRRLAHPLLDLSRANSHPHLPHPAPLRSLSRFLNQPREKLHLHAGGNRLRAQVRISPRSETAGFGARSARANSLRGRRAGSQNPAHVLPPQPRNKVSAKSS